MVASEIINRSYVPRIYRGWEYEYGTTVHMITQIKRIEPVSIYHALRASLILLFGIK